MITKGYIYSMQYLATGMPHYILSNIRNWTVVNLSVFLDHQQFLKSEVHNNILRFETDKLFFPFHSGEKSGHLNNLNAKNLF